MGGTSKACEGVDRRLSWRSIHRGKYNMIHRFVIVGLMLATFSSSALAVQGRNPGSLLLYPEFDNRMGTVSILSVTNVDVDETHDPIDVEFVYVGRFDGPDGNDAGCLEFNRTQTLTPADTFTCLTNFHNPGQEQGYVFVFAKDVDTGVAKTHNYLTGSVITVNGFANFEFSVNPISFEGINSDNGDGDILLDGNEYSGVAGQIVIPRFLGQTGQRRSELIMIGLTGGRDFNTIVDFLIFNDNEEVFSSEYTFRCWDRVYLEEISLIFRNDFLANWTNDDPNEIVGQNNVETGWMQVTGHLASDQNVSIPDPAVYAVLIERVGNLGMSDLPFEMGTTRTNGVLYTVPTGN
ncbi:MAG: hypothetical protein ACI9F9_000143 [Candidatus Paceibacteria bacterium]|jgi:hypothetical protein